MDVELLRKRRDRLRHPLHDRKRMFRRALPHREQGRRELGVEMDDVVQPVKEPGGLARDALDPEALRRTEGTGEEAEDGVHGVDKGRFGRGELPDDFLPLELERPELVEEGLVERRVDGLAEGESGKVLMRGERRRREGRVRLMGRTSVSRRERRRRAKVFGRVEGRRGRMESRSG
jgi:hypothetical protein